MKRQLTTLTGLLAIAIALLSSTPLHGQEQNGQPLISPEEAIAIATLRETGRPDFRISDAGDEEIYLGFDANLVFNPDENEYLVVWTGTSNEGGLDEEEEEIYGQRVNAISGREVGANDFRISHMGPDGNSRYEAETPSVAYNPATKQYLVVWIANEERQGLDSQEIEVFGRVLDREGNSVSSDDLRLTHVGPDGNRDDSASMPDVVYNASSNAYFLVYRGITGGKQQIYGQVVATDGSSDAASRFQISNIAANPNNPGAAHTPTVAHNSLSNEYLVVWSGSDRPNGELEIYGQVLQAGIEPAALDNVRISDMGPDGDTGAGALLPSVAHDTTENRYLVVWAGVDEVPPSGNLFDGVKHVYGQLLKADGAETAENDVRISTTGLEVDPNFTAIIPDVTYNTLTNQFLVVWGGPNVLATDTEIFGRLLNADATVDGLDPFRISQAGPDDTDHFIAGIPAVAANSRTDGYFVTWVGLDDRTGLGPREAEIFGQLLDPAGAEFGEDDRLLSDMGRDDTYDAVTPAVAYNPTDHEYLVVWSADDPMRGLPDGQFEIYGQRVDAATGREIGIHDFLISAFNASGNLEGYDAVTPDVAYNSTRREYLVVWRNDAGVDDEFEIFGSRVNAAGVTGPTVRISNMGPARDPNFVARDPAVVYNTRDDRYLVTWWGNHDLPGLDPQELEIYAQILSGSAIPIGDMFRVSQAGPDNDRAYEAFSPRAVYNTIRNQYLIVWAGSDDAGDMVPGETEIFVRLFHDTGAPVASQELRISEAGTDGDLSVSARLPDVTYNPAQDEYLVVWQANDANADLPQGKTEIFGQLLDASSNQTGANDFRISMTGATYSAGHYAQQARASYEPSTGQYVVIWQANDDFGGTGREREIAGQFVEADGARILDQDLRLSQMGPDGDDGYRATQPALACAPESPSCLVVWSGDHNAGTLVDDEREIFGQLLGENTPPVAQPDEYHTTQDIDVLVLPPGVLNNDSDADGDPLTAVLEDAPAHGNLVFDQSGAFVYTPAAGFTGTDAFTYHASDGEAVSETVVVTIEVAPLDPEPDPVPEPQPDLHQVYLPIMSR